MTSLLAESIEVPFHDDSIKIVGLEWVASDGLTVTIKSKRTGRGCKVHFESVAGVRMLDELNLASWWLTPPRQALARSWLHQVTSGGWYDFEATRSDFYSQHEEKLPEYLITGFQECLSVFSHTQPVVVEARE
jgi:hypothetical protein